jgi:hypothetical protein
MGMDQFGPGGMVIWPRPQQRIILVPSLLGVTENPLLIIRFNSRSVLGFEGPPAGCVSGERPRAQEWVEKSSERTELVVAVVEH